MYMAEQSVDTVQPQTLHERHTSALRLETTATLNAAISSESLILKQSEYVSLFSEDTFYVS